MFEHLDDTRPLPAPTADEVATVVRGGEQMRQRHRRRRIVAVTLPLATVVAVVAVVIGTSPFSRQSLPQPITSGSPTPAPSGTPDDGSIAPRGPFEALVVRGTELVAVDGSGRERPVRDLRPLGLKAADLQYAYTSTAGWLAVPPFGQPTATFGHELVDLTRPAVEPVLVKGIFDQRTWSPDGTRLFTMGNHGVAVVIDAATGRQTEVDMHGGAPPGGGPSLIWAADGTGIVIESSDPGQPLAIAPVDGGPLRREIPSLWERGGRSVVAGGFVLQKAACAVSVDQCQPGAVRVGTPDGDTTLLYSGQVERTQLADASLARDARSTYILLVSPEPNTLLVARSDAALTPTVLSTVPVVTTDLAGLEMSPDDRTALVSTISNQNAPEPTFNSYLVPLDGNAPRAIDGSFAGWVPTTVVDAIIAAAR